VCVSSMKLFFAVLLLLLVHEHLLQVFCLIKGLLLFVVLLLAICRLLWRLRHVIDDLRAQLAAWGCVGCSAD